MAFQNNYLRPHTKTKKRDKFKAKRDRIYAAMKAREDKKLRTLKRKEE